MRGSGKMSKWQFIFLIVFMQIGLAILIEPAFVAERAGKGSVIALLLALAAAFAMLPVHIALVHAYPGRDLTGIMEGVLGKWAGRLVMLALLLCCPLFITVFVVRSMSDFVKWAFLPNTPEMLISTLFVLSMLYFVRSGVVAAAHLAQLMFWPIVLLIVMMLVLVLPVADVSNVIPMFDLGVKPIVIAAILVLVFPLMETFLFLTFVPYMDDSAKIASALRISVLISGVMLLVTTLITILVLGPELVSISLFPAYLLSKKISIGNFLERLEVFMAVIWFTTLFFRSAVMFMITCLGLAGIFNLPTHKSIATPLAFVVIGLSTIIIRNTQDYSGTASIWLYYGFICLGCLPLLLLIIHGCKKLFARRAPQSH